MPKITLSGGSHHGKVLTILHGASVRMASTGEIYERPKDGSSVWKLVQTEGEKRT